MNLYTLRFFTPPSTSLHTLMRRAITRQAASCWYRAWLSSCLTLCRPWRRVCVSSMSASHSSWKIPSSPGTLVEGALRGLTALLAFTGSKSSGASSEPVIGHLPVSLTYFSTSFFSNRCPDLLLTTGWSGTFPLMLQNMLLLVRACCTKDLRLGVQAETAWLQAHTDGLKHSTKPPPLCYCHTPGLAPVHVYAS